MDHFKRAVEILAAYALLAVVQSGDAVSTSIDALFTEDSDGCVRVRTVP